MPFTKLLGFIVKAKNLIVSLLLIVLNVNLTDEI